MKVLKANNRQPLCTIADLVPNAGVTALFNNEQIALFYLPGENPTVYATANRDPIGNANVLSRGIVGDIKGELVVASPLYKQHFSLLSGQCLEDDSVSIPVYDVVVDGDRVLIASW
jgi:nitrite reductase (NADH) small subunit